MLAWCQRIVQLSNIHDLKTYELKTG